MLIVLIILILFGGKKIPELAKGLGSGIKNFKKAVKEDDDETTAETKKVESTENKAESTTTTATETKQS